MTGLDLDIAVERLRTAPLDDPMFQADPGALPVPYRIAVSRVFKTAKKRKLPAATTEQLEAWGDERAPFGEMNEEEVWVGLVSGGFFETLHVRAALGRVLESHRHESELVGFERKVALQAGAYVGADRVKGLLMVCLERGFRAEGRRGGRGGQNE